MANTNTNTNGGNSEKQTIVINPVDTLIRINATEGKRSLILSKPWYCRAYMDCMELVPGAIKIIRSLRALAGKAEIILSSPYDEEIVWAIACKFQIPCDKIRRVRGGETAGTIIQVETQLRKMAS